MQEPKQVLVARAGRDPLESGRGLGGQVELLRVETLRQMQGAAQEPEEVGEHLPGVGSVVLDGPDRLRHARALAGEDGLEETGQQLGVDSPEQPADILVGKLAAAEGGELIEQGHRVAHAAFRSARDQAKGCPAGLDLLLLADPRQVGNHRVGGHAAEVELLAAGQDRRRHDLDFGRREDESEMGGRLLDDLEQSVEGLSGQPVDLVEHDDLVAIPGRAVLEALGEIANLFDLGVGCGVDLEHVEVSALPDFLADEALVAGVGDRAGGGTVFSDAVQGLREDARGGRLADATDAREQVGLGDSPLAQRVPQRGHDRLLPDQVGERLGAPLARQRLVRHGLPASPEEELRDGSRRRRVGRS